MFENTFTLNPTDGRKSFYGKCVVKRNDDGSMTLYSYGTPVCKYAKGKLWKLWNDYSVTTMRHVNAFAAFCGKNVGGKSWWTSLEMWK